jgi:hypothetical protein
LRVAQEHGSRGGSYGDVDGRRSWSGRRCGRRRRLDNGGESTGAARCACDRDEKNEDCEWKVWLRWLVTIARGVLREGPHGAAKCRRRAREQSGGGSRFKFSSGKAERGRKLLELGALGQMGKRNAELGGPARVGRNSRNRHGVMPF